MTLYLCDFLRSVITVLHFELAGGRGWSSPWGGLRLKHPSTSCKPVDWGCTWSRLCIVSPPVVSVSSFHSHFQYPVPL
jgi:hypothetical protein